MKVISRDPYIRANFVRQTAVVAAQARCEWCDNPGRPLIGADVPSHANSGRHRLFQYGWQWDSHPNRIEWDKYLFCSVGCRQDFYH